MTRAFFDSNTLLYVLSGDERKADRAHSLAAGGGVISVQVLNEFAHVALRKFKASLVEVHDSLHAFEELFTVAPLTLFSHRRGLQLSERYRLSVFDGQILAAALIADCDVIYSEDMQHGQVIDGSLTILNPFA